MQVSIYLIATAPSGLKVIGEVQIHVESLWFLKKQVCYVRMRELLRRIVLQCDATVTQCDAV